MLQDRLPGKRDADFKLDGRHTEAHWTPGKRKRALTWSPGWTRWAKGPTGTSLIVPKRTELGAWGRLSKRNPESSSNQGPPISSSDPRIRMIRGGKDLNQWNRIIKKEADAGGSYQGRSSDPRIRIIRRGQDLNQWDRIIKRKTDAGGFIRIVRGDNSDEDVEKWKLTR